MYRYKAFGRNIISDILIREFIEASSEGLPEILIQSGKNALADFILSIKSVGTFYISKGSEILYQAEANIHPDVFRLFLLGSAMGALLQQRGLVVLHGNALSWKGDSCEIYVGHSGAGKSTMAAYAWQQGAHILADDICAIEFDEHGCPRVIPSYPQLKLWQNTADLLRIETNALPRVRPEDEKYALRIEAQFCDMLLPLKTIYQIQPDLKEPQEVRGVAKIRLLMEQSYRAHFLSKMKREQAYIQRLIYLAGRVQIKQLPRMNLDADV